MQSTRMLQFKSLIQCFPCTKQLFAFKANTLRRLFRRNSSRVAQGPLFLEKVVVPPTRGF